MIDAMCVDVAGWTSGERETRDVRTVFTYRRFDDVWAPDVVWCRDEDMINTVPRLIGTIEKQGLLVFQDPSDGTVSTRKDVAVSLGSMSPCHVLTTTPDTSGVPTAHARVMETVTRTWNTWVIGHMKWLSMSSRSSSRSSSSSSTTSSVMSNETRRIIIVNENASMMHCRHMLTQALQYTIRVMSAIPAVMIASMDQTSLACYVSSVFDVVTCQVHAFLTQYPYAQITGKKMGVLSFGDDSGNDMFAKIMSEWVAALKRGAFIGRDVGVMFREWRFVTMRYFRAQFPQWMEHARVRCPNGTIHCFTRRGITVDNCDEVPWMDADNRSIPHQGPGAPRVLAYLSITPKFDSADVRARMRPLVGNLLAGLHFCTTNEVVLTR